MNTLLSKIVANPYKFIPFILVALIIGYFGYGYVAEHRKTDDAFVKCFSDATYEEMEDARIPGTYRYRELDKDSLHAKGVLCQIDCKKRGYCSPWWPSR